VSEGPTWDVHAHAVPNGLLDLLSDGALDAVSLVKTEKGRVLRFGRAEDSAPVRDDFDDLDARLRSMNAAGIDRQLVSPWIDLTAYSLPVDDGAALARLINERMAATVARYPERMTGLATVPLQDPSLAALELRSAVSNLGLAGVQIGTTVAGRDLDDPSLDEFWSTAEQLRCIVLLHPHQHGIAGRSSTPHFLGNLVGNPSESTVAIASLVFGGVLERYPDLRIVAVHGGGFAPWQVGRWDHGYEVARSLTGGDITQPPSTYLRRIYFDTILHDPLRLAALIAWAGIDRVVLGTDYPFPMGDPTPIASLDAVAGLDAGARRAIVSDNVAALVAGVRR
jgi:aminocarboxymuconate-semialdehyde decarboxylase